MRRPDITAGGGPSLAVVVPMYNEEANAARCVAALEPVVASLGDRGGLIVVDDGSRDRTAEILGTLLREGARFRLVRRPANGGYGAALRTGAEVAGRLGYHYVLFMDSDLTNPPEHLFRFLPAMDRGIDVIKACRYGLGGSARGVPLKRYIISRLGNWLVRPLFAIDVPDATNGFRCLKTQLFLSMPLTERGFSVIMEELYWAKRLACTFANVPTTLSDRPKGTRTSSFSYCPRTFLDYIRYACRAALLPWSGSPRRTGRRSRAGGGVKG
jgi:glycosyltransferase involved in cell wall biosynthesis